MGDRVLTSAMASRRPTSGDEETLAMGDWVVNAATASRSRNSDAGTSVKTVIITSSPRSSLLLEYFRKHCDRVQEWGVDGLLFSSLSVNGFAEGHLVYALKSAASFTSCTTLCIDSFMPWHRAVTLLCEVFSSLPSITHLYLYLPSLSPDDAQLLRGTVLDKLFCGVQLQSLFLAADVCPEPLLIPSLTSSSASSLKVLSISLESSPATLELTQSICLELSHNTISTLRSFSLVCPQDEFPVNVDIDFEMLGKMLVSNTSLTSFTLYNVRVSEIGVRHLFTSLKKNRHLTFLSLAHCTIIGATSSWPITSILDSLQVNATLCRVDFTGTPLKYDEAITAQLLRNGKNAERMQVLESRLVRPTTVRLFLCGLPYSGKTTLSRSLANWNRNASWLSRARSTRKPKRTRGIDVTILEKEEYGEHQRVLLWDMAGQTEFHSFHDSMFPDLSSRATPAMFLFVWNPFEVDTKDKHLQGQSKGPHQFTEEFKYWLRFIASKTMKSEVFKPRVLVAVTRADLDADDWRLWLMKEFTTLQQDFQEVIRFDKEDFFYLNAKDHLSAGQLGSHIFDCAKAVLKELPDEHQECAEAREVLGNMVRDNQIPPLITKQMFHQLCQEALHMDSQEKREAVGLSLNDSGDLIYFTSLELVVLDTQWFCHRIMGDLLNDIMTTKSLSKDVFIPGDALEALLERKVNTRATSTSKLINMRFERFKSMKVSGHDLVKLLMGLQLACLEDMDENNSRIFLSIGLLGKAKRTLYPSNCLVNDQKSVTTYLGRRLSCKNFKRTFLTPWLFPLLQVTFHKLLHDREFPVRAWLEEDVMAFALDGVKVFMEFCRLEGKDHFIDVLVYSSKSLDDTIKWLQENVLLEVERVCREPRGNQGVELAHAIIQPACIEKFLGPSERPTILMTDLRSKLNKEVEKKGVNDGVKVEHSWQAFSSSSNFVVDLLGKAETTKVIETCLLGLRDAEREISHLFVEKVGSSEPEKSQYGNMSQPSEERGIPRDESGALEIQAVMRDLEKMRNEIQDFRNVVLPKLSELFTFVKEGEAGKLPRIPIVTKDDGIVRRVVAGIVPGLQNMRLHFLCECYSQPQHIVDGKQGLSLATIDDGLLKRGLPYINAFLKAACVAAKVGAHVAVGFGHNIPDFTQVLANIVDANTFNEFPTMMSVTDGWNSSSKVDFKEGQQWVFDVLSNRDCIKGDKINAVFGLRRVRFPDSRAGWVCEEHYVEGTPWPTWCVH